MHLRIKLLFIVSLSVLCTLNPSCKHTTDDAHELYRKYAIKNIQLKKVKSHD